MLRGEGFDRWSASLLFLGDALERRAIFFAVHEATVVRVAFGPRICFGIVELSSVADSANAMSVAFRRICGHSGLLMFQDMGSQRLNALA